MTGLDDTAPALEGAGTGRGRCAAGRSRQPEQVEIQIKYAGYIERQDEEVDAP